MPVRKNSVIKKSSLSEKKKILKKLENKVRDNCKSVCKKRNEPGCNDKCLVASKEKLTKVIKMVKNKVDKKIRNKCKSFCKKRNDPGCNDKCFLSIQENIKKIIKTKSNKR